MKCRKIYRTAKYGSALAALAAFFWLAAYETGMLWKQSHTEWVSKERHLLSVSLLYIVILIVFLLLFEVCHMERRRFMDLICGQLLAVLCTNICLGLILGAVSDVLFFRAAAVCLMLSGIEAAAGLLWIIFFYRLYLHLRICRNAVLIYGDRDDCGEMLRINSRENRYFHILGMMRWDEDSEKLFSRICTYEMVCIGDIPEEPRTRIIRFCQHNKISVCCIPRIPDIYMRSAQDIQLHDKLLLVPGSGCISEGRQTVKRLCDIAGAAVLLAAVSPVMLLTAVCILLEDGRPVIYRQERVTMNERPFLMLKFRSMRTDAEKDGPRLALEQDNRVTKTGKIIRNLHVDELPQLINVLKGEMSLVGPRPERKQFIEQYAKTVPEFAERLRVRGGMTGYAQVYSRYNTGPLEKAKYDLIYIYNYSLRLDIRLLFLTLRVLFQKETTEGVSEDQISALKNPESGPDIGKNEKQE